jgi:hypothetical protein
MSVWNISLYLEVWHKAEGEKKNVYTIIIWLFQKRQKYNNINLFFFLS